MTDEEKGRQSQDHSEALSFLKHDDEDRFPPPPPDNMRPQVPGRRFWISAFVNTTSTAAIVFVNKRIFANAALRHAQVTFAAFHFAITSLLLYSLSRPPLALFSPRPLSPLRLLPLALAMIANVVLTNVSLAYSSIQFYQVARVLLTPCVAALHYLFYNRRTPSRAVLALIPVCVGVGVVSYFDTVPQRGDDAAAAAPEQATRPVGVVFALAGVLASSLYTVWVKRYHETFDCSSMQLLLNQAPVSVGVMLYIIPFSDDVTVWRDTEAGSYLLILLSGFFACLINLSQFVIINDAGPVSSTVVGHFKTCSIVAMGWIVSGKPLTDGSLVGIALAVGGIIAYSYVMQQHSSRK